jgi:hypothetical protein
MNNYKDKRNIPEDEVANLINNKEAAKIIGTTELLYRLKKNGMVKNYKHGLYRRSEILEVKAELEYRKSLKKPDWPKK